MIHSQFDAQINCEPNLVNRPYSTKRKRIFMSDNNPYTAANANTDHLPAKSNTGKLIGYISKFVFAGSALLFIGGIAFIAYIASTTDGNQAGAIDAASVPIAKGLTAIGMSIFLGVIGLILHFVGKFLQRKK